MNDRSRTRPGPGIPVDKLILDRMNAFTTDGSGCPAPAGAHWSEFPRGRHFPAMEAPAQLAADLQAFFWPLR